MLFLFIEAVSFVNVLQSSLLGVQTSQAWCENCNKYQPTVTGGKYDFKNFNFRSKQLLFHLIIINFNEDN